MSSESVRRGQELQLQLVMASLQSPRLSAHAIANYDSIGVDYVALGAKLAIYLAFLNRCSQREIYRSEWFPCSDDVRR